MVEQLQRWRHRLARDVVIQPEGNVAHARALRSPIARVIAANPPPALALTGMRYPTDCSMEYSEIMPILVS